MNNPCASSDPSDSRPDGRRPEPPSLAQRLARQQGESPDELLAESRFALAQALWEAPPHRGRDRVRAMILAEEARAALAELGEAWTEVVARIERWIAERTEP